MITRSQAFARAGLLGNPSDIYGGKVVSFLVRNYGTRVRLWESPSLTLLLNPEHDPAEFADLDTLLDSVRRYGYYGMQRLLLATCARFAAYCRERRISLRKASFTLEYETNIPRQSGLGGSSATIIAALRALLRFYRVPARAVPPKELAGLALSVETTELGIVAGPQDRVVQAYGGLTYMDFSGRMGRYERLDPRLLPRFGLSYLTQEHMGTHESGKAHSNVRDRWHQGDREARAVMREIARCAETGRGALLRRDVKTLGRLMNRNFDLRRRLFGDSVIGEHTIAMVEIARAAGQPASLPGSGGAALVLLKDRGVERSLAEAYAAQGYRFAVVRPA